MHRSAALLVSLLCAAPVFAQSAAPAADTLPPLISDLTVRPNDSPLVRAAKATVRNRATVSPAMRRGVVIDNASIRRTTGTISQSSAPYSVPSVPASNNQPTAAAPALTAEQAAARAAAEKKVDALKNEQARRAAEAEQPYGHSDDEDRNTMRLEQLPKQINEAEHGFAPPPTPDRGFTPPPTPQPPQ